MKAGIVGSVLLILAGGAAGGALFMRDTQELEAAQQNYQEALALFDQGELERAQASFALALEHVDGISGVTGKRQAALTIAADAARWAAALGALAAVDENPAAAARWVDGEGQILGRAPPAPLLAKLRRELDGPLLQAALAMESQGNFDAGKVLLEQAQSELASAGSPLESQAQAALARIELRRRLSAAEDALRRGQWADAERSSDDARRALQEVGEELEPKERTRIEQRLGILAAAASDRQALGQFRSAVDGLWRRVPTNDLGELADPVARVSAPALQGGHPGADELRSELTELSRRLERVREVAEQFRGMVLARERGGTSVFVDKHEVTNEQFARFVAAGGYEKPELWPEEARERITRFVGKDRVAGPAFWTGGRPAGADLSRPVVGITRFEAQAYAAWAGKRLPSLADWKAAAGADAGKYPWGDEWQAGRARVRAEGEPAELAAVGSYPDGAGPTGALDVIGNVREFVNDEGQGRWLAVGGSFRALPTQSTSGSAVRVIDSLRSREIGFRCAKELRWDG